MVDYVNQRIQEFIIEIVDIDSTEWRNVRTNPRRTLNPKIKNLPTGVPFIVEVLSNSSKYIPYE